jgi:hypothetical protein
MRTSTFLVLVLAACTFGAPPAPQPKARETAQLVEKLGAADFAEREAATKRLEELGTLALDELRAACKSEDPEIARRAIDLVRAIERRAVAERALAPTMVELTARAAPLDAVLAALSKQAKYEVVLSGPNVKELAAKKITVATGKVPFWEAVLKVCDVAELHIAGAGGFLAPGSGPYTGTFAKTADGKAVRFTMHTEQAVVLESRYATRKRPAFVQGGVLVEVFPMGAAPGRAALLQFWPEPKLGWQSIAHLKVTSAVDAEGRKLVPDLTPPPAPQKPLGPPIVDGTSSLLVLADQLNPNVRQAIARFKTGDEPSPLVCELTGSALVIMRTGVEPLATVPLDPKKAVVVTGRAGVELTASTSTDGSGKKFVEVTLKFAPQTVDPVRASDALPDIKPDATGGNRSVLGLRVTDDDGNAFPLALTTQQSDFDRTGQRIVARMTLEAVVTKDGPADPAQVVFWGSTARPVEVPFTLKDVPLK